MLIVKYNSLLSSLQCWMVSQTLGNKYLFFGWVDEEGDNFTLRSDEELKIALAEMKDNMLEVQIKMKENLNKRSEDTSSATIFCKG